MSKFLEIKMNKKNRKDMIAQVICTKYKPINLKKKIDLKANNRNTLEIKSIIIIINNNTDKMELKIQRNHKHIKLNKIIS